MTKECNLLISNEKEDKTMNDAKQATINGGLGDKLIDVVYETTDYEKFKFLNQNRNVDTARIDKIISSMQEKLLKTEILVNKNFEIIDGQHRYCALRKLGLPIRYVIDPEAGIEDCRRMNQYNKSWMIQDWVLSWAECDDEETAKNYKNLMQCINDYNMPTYRILRLCNASRYTNKNKELVSKIKSGDLKFSEENVTDLARTVTMVNDLISALAFTKKTNDVFWYSAKVMFETEGYKHQTMIKNCRLYRSTFAMTANMETQLKEFSRIYNKRLRRENQLYFEDYLRNKGYAVREY